MLGFAKLLYNAFLELSTLLCKNIVATVPKATSGQVELIQGKEGYCVSALGGQTEGYTLSTILVFLHFKFLLPACSSREKG